MDEFRCISVVSLLIIFIVSPFALVYSYGSCRERCCTGKTISCHSNYLKDGNIRRCYCDEFCVRGDDCCPDYNLYCSPGRKQDCEVSSWSDWSACTKKCGVGSNQRVRRVIKEAQHGGKACPALKQMRACVARKCPVKKQSHGKSIAAARLITEIAKILPVEFDQHREKNKHNMKTDVRKNLFSRYHANEESAKYSLCARYRLTYVQSGCRFPFKANDWARRLRKHQGICVTCHPSVSNSYPEKRCPGIGQRGRRSSWSALNVPYCGGQWIRISTVKKCHCGKDLPNAYTFV